MIFCLLFQPYNRVSGQEVNNRNRSQLTPRYLVYQTEGKQWTAYFYETIELLIMRPLGLHHQK